MTRSSRRSTPGTRSPGAAPTPPESAAPPESPLTPKGRETRERILQAARAQFGEHGYAGVRIADITAAAGISQGAFYRYFHDRRAVVLELLEVAAGEVYTSVRAPWDRGDPAASVRETTLRYFEYYRANRDLAGLVMELSPTDPEVAALGARSRDRFYTRIAKSLERGIAAGAIRADIDVRVAAEMLGSMTEFYALHRFSAVESPVADIPLDEAARSLAEIWVRGVGATAG